MVTNEIREGGGHPLLLQREAQAWIRRLVSGEATDADADALRDWCGQSADHAAAFSQASQLWTAFGPAGQSLLDEQSGGAGKAAARRKMMSRRAVLGGAVAASAAGLLIMRPPLGLWPSLSELGADYRTGIGEQRQLVMRDGVAIQMNTRTSLSVRKEGDASAIELIAGEASFTTSDRRPGDRQPGDHQPGPLSVIAAGGRAIALNASFEMRRLDNGACVTCLAHEVRVEYRARTVTLGPRQRVTYRAEEGFGDIQSIDPEIVSAWQKGMLVFNMTPLAEVVEELNRYRVGRIVLLNKKLAQSPVNGRFRIDRPDEALMQIEQAFGVQGRSLPGGFVLLS